MVGASTSVPVHDVEHGRAAALCEVVPQVGAEVPDGAAVAVDVVAVPAGREVGVGPELLACGEADDHRGQHERVAAQVEPLRAPTGIEAGIGPGWRRESGEGVVEELEGNVVVGRHDRDRPASVAARKRRDSKIDVLGCAERGGRT